MTRPLIDTENLPNLDAMEDDALLEHLAAIAHELGARADALRAHRLEVFQAARRRTPPITQRRIAEAAGISEVAVIQSLRKDARARAGS